MTSTYEAEYKAHIELFKKHNVDVVVCDHFGLACIDAAYTMKLPFIITTAVTEGDDASAPYTNDNMLTRMDPTTLDESLNTRFYNKFIVPLRIAWTAYPEFKALAKTMARAGAEPNDGPPNTRWADSVKLVNSVFGLESPRPVGPLVEYVGPIIPRTYQPLTEDLKQYLDAHSRVAYIAFGQHASAKADSLTKILTALLENIEQGNLDGFLWATVLSTENFPETVTTSSKKTYVVADMFNNAELHARMVKWAPQYAVLHHPSTVMFVSHGGAGSIYESLFAGKRLVIFPFFGDQPGNAWSIERNQLGGRFNKNTPQHEMTQVIRKVALDEDGQIQSNVQRYKALVQIRSRNGILRGADAVEEVAFLQQNGKVPHRYEVAREMSYIKAHNIDLYAVLFLILAIPLVALYRIITIIASKAIQSTYQTKKLKSL
ncbi:hypothetical protein DFQ28_011323 [Apophysomyces sp. BC1034]|nr:hypothetical protein DFQ30_001993 [Apophysomyces sp. BC1015]KAG0181183.1 hypothetical protein DFQ29_009054 [Apophysomyces sp. BC1021]KAG0191641.1 hypothetical protein DFQ28_011323 [Apophysomyces sp. BC1034]